MKNYYLGWVLLILSVSGCSVITQFKIKNETGCNVFVTSSHTKQTVAIPDGADKLLPHTAGDIIVEFANGVKRTYKNVSPLQFNNTPYSVRRKHLRYSTITVSILLDKAGKIFVVRGTNETNLSDKDQPDGFPLAPFSQ